MINEFDADLDGTLNYDEFQNLLLPATNDRLRSICVKRSELDSSKRIVPSIYVLKTAAKILHYEKSLTVQKM